ncbi:MAG: hypothetical protein ACFFD2_07060 [Promethearchaeota archaeon]
MKKRIFLLFFTVGLLSTTFAIPALANGIPSWALDETDLTGWYVQAEEFIGSESYMGITITVWYQIWSNAETWIASTAAFAIVVIDFGKDKICVLGECIQLSEIFSEMAPPGATEKNYTGWTAVYVWEESYPTFWMGLGYKSPGVIVFCMSVDTLAEPTPPVFSKVKVKSPSLGGFTEGDLDTVMTALGPKIPGGIPGFTLGAILVSLTVIITMTILLRRDKLRIKI